MSIGLGLLIAVTILVIALVIARSARSLLFDVDKQAKRIPRSEREQAMRSMMERLQKLNVRCPRCGDGSFMRLGTKDGYQCEGCAHDFTGPPHPTLKDG
jgi:ribosomal protein S27AE